MSRMGTMPCGFGHVRQQIRKWPAVWITLRTSGPFYSCCFSLCRIYTWTIACASPECYGHRGVTGRWKKSGPWVTGTEPMSDVVPRVMKGGGAEVRGRSLPYLHILFPGLAFEPAYVTSPTVGGPLWWRVCIDTADSRS